jgi:hypothetical protein
MSKEFSSSRKITSKVEHHCHIRLSTHAQNTLQKKSVSLYFIFAVCNQTVSCKCGGSYFFKMVNLLVFTLVALLSTRNEMV